MSPQNNNKIEPKLLEEAAAWHARVNSGHAVTEDWLSLTAWLEKTPNHARAYDAIEDIVIDAEVLPISKFGENIYDDSSTNINISEPARTEHPGFFAKTQHLAFSKTAGFAILLGFLITGMMFTPNLTSPQTSDLISHSYVADNKANQVTLADGSIVNLNVNSEITALLTEKERRITMTKGEAIFNVHKDPSRPFIITVADTDIRVVGTVFNVLKEQTGLSVTVSEGIVEVMPSSRKANDVSNRLFPNEILNAGQQFQLKDEDNTPIVRNIEVENILAWRKGQLIYEDANLQQIMSDLGRYLNKPVDVATSLSSLSFSGVLLTDDIEASFLVLESSLPIKVSYSDALIAVNPQ
jgi:transmembrane sensor